MFSEDAILVIMLAQDEVRRLRQDEIGTAFLLLGLIGEGQGIAAKVLRSMGVNLANARHEVENLVERGIEPTGSEVPSFSENAKSVLDRSLEEAQKLGSSTLDTEHLLLALTTLKQGTAFQVLGNLHIDLDQLQTRVLAAMNEPEAINASQSLPATPEENAVQATLTELQTTIETDSDLTEEDKAEILRHGQQLARFWRIRHYDSIQRTNRQSMRILRGTIAGLPSNSAYLPTYQRIIAALVEQFQPTI